jgi:hypothetical protein
MKWFSERYGYTKPSNVIIREQITREIQNAICSAFDVLPDLFDKAGARYGEYDYIDVERFLWTQVLNERESKFSEGRNYHIVSTWYIENSEKQWYEKLELIEKVIDYLIRLSSNYDKRYYREVVNAFTERLNSDFERLHFAYRIVDNKIVEISSKAEIESIEKALTDSPSNIREHLNKALQHYAKRPEGDYRNSIKESISAVEAWCREKTGETTLGPALSKLEKKGITLHPMLKQAFDKLYFYTNDKETGIRHALMDETGTYMPNAEEAMFMLVSCSAFINYLNVKEK